MMSGARTSAATVVTTRTTVANEMTAEMEREGLLLVRLDSWSTKTGMKVAERTPPRTMS